MDLVCKEKYAEEEVEELRLKSWFLSCYSLIRHTEQLLEEHEERLCIRVLVTLRDMMAFDMDYGEKVCTNL